MHGALECCNVDIIRKKEEVGQANYLLFYKLEVPVPFISGGIQLPKMELTSRTARENHSISFYLHLLQMR